ncbi:MAG: tRNA-guanine(15) transglycosylase [Methanobacterium sp. PtaU1.Bin242]|nr:MAG: tRNA-guanine(15) transglycosylase [Methanobacterium sp. PtaU1.Bin242]
MPDGTYKLENLVEMPCSCEVCSNYTPEDLRNMKKVERTKLLAQHNLQVSFAEIRHIRQALSEGSLWELVEERCKTHPYLLDALRNVKKYTKNLEKYDPPYKKSAFFYSGPESLNRPEVHRHLKLLERLPQRKRLLILPSSEKPYSKHISPDINRFFSNTKKLDLDEVINSFEDLDVLVVDVPFAVIPIEIEEVYPLAQNESPHIMDEDARKFVGEFLKKYIKNYHEVIISAEVLESWDLSLDPKFEYYYNQPLRIDVNDERRIKYIADYQFGRGTGEALFKGDIKIVKSKKTGKIRHIYHDDHLLANLRASDGVLVMGKKGALRLHRYLPYPQNRVVVNEEAEPFAMEGKSIFAKFVIDCDVNIKSSDEVLIVNQKDELLAFGKSILCAREIMDFNTGQAVKTRKGGF